MLYFALRAFGFLITNIYIKITIYCSPLLLSFSILSLLFLILSSISLPSSLHISPHSLLISSHVFDLLTVLASPIVHTSASRYHFSLSHTHSSLPIYFDSLILSLLSYLSASLSLYLFIHLLLVHFLAGSPSYSLLLLENFLQFLLSLIPSKPVPVYLYFPVSYFYPFSSISLFSGQLS
jgi:hypothetical protein